MIPPFTLRNASEIQGAIFISSIFALILWAVLWTVFYELRVRKWLKEGATHTVLAKARVTSIFKDSDGSRTHVHYLFVAANGTQYKGTQSFPNLGATLAGIDYTPEQMVTVVYNPDYPKLNYIQGRLSYYERSETHYIQGFMSMVLLMFAFFKSQSVVWGIAAVMAFNLSLAGIRLTIHRPKK